jgi:hypothetical protein
MTLNDLFTDEQQTSVSFLHAFKTNDEGQHEAVYSTLSDYVQSGNGLAGTFKLENSTFIVFYATKAVAHVTKEGIQFFDPYCQSVVINGTNYKAEILRQYAEIISSIPEDVRVLCPP